MPDRRKQKRGGFLKGIASKNDTFQIVRVKDIILNPDHPQFVNFGNYASIGTIFYEVDGLQGSNTQMSAKPFDSNSSSFPLVNELVLLIEGPNSDIGVDTSSKSFYYFNMFNIWGSPHHNAYPNPIIPNTTETFTTQEPTSNNTTEINSTNFNSPFNISQNTFIEKSNINPLLKSIPGDVVHEGRWGNSIRLSSTANPNFVNKTKSTVWNTWSKSGKNGDPITLIRNGQNPDGPKDGYIPTTEDIKGDLSSIYLTSFQQLSKLQLQNETFFSYYRGGQATTGLGVKLTPETPSTYNFPQVIINSDRLVFNAKEDHVLISGQKSVYLSSNESLNFDTKRFIIGAGEIKLGSPDATQPLVLGETLRFDLESITTALINIISILEVSSIYPGGAPVPDTVTSLTAVQVKDLLKDVIKDFKKDSNGNSKILSKVSKTI